MDLSQFWFDIDGRAVGFLLIAGLALIAELAFRAGAWLRTARGLRPGESFTVAEAGVLGLVALILGFSFSLAVSRFDTRQETIVREANAIGTTYLRSSYLPPAARDTFRSALRDYASRRLQLYQRYSDFSVRSRIARESSALRKTLWRIVTNEIQTHPGLPASLLTQTTNDMFDVGGELDASFANHVPGAIVVLVVAASLGGAALIGFGFGIGGSSHIAVSALYALIVTLLVTTTLDLDRPSRGWIKVRLTPLADQLEAISSAPPYGVGPLRSMSAE